MNEALSEMIGALDLEIAAIGDKGAKVELRGGERLRESIGSCLYKFVVAEDLNLRDDTPVNVIVGQENVSGELVSFRDGVLIVALDRDIGANVASARLEARASFLVERIKERLEKVRGGEAQFNRQSAERVLGLAPPHTGDAEPHQAVLAGDVNEDQALSVRRSLGSDTTYIWGPPGTGKTTTLARIVEAHYRAGRSVLLVSNTNIAVDTALERVAERLKGEPDFHQGLVIRHGPIVKEELRQRFGRQIILEEIVARLGESLRREKEQLTKEADQYKPEERSLAGALKNLEQIEQTRRSLAKSEKALEVTKSDAAARTREAEWHRGRCATLRANLERARTMGAVRRFFLGLRPKRLEQEIVLANRAAYVSEEAARALAADFPKREDEIIALRREIERLAAETARYPPTFEIETSLNAIRNRLGEIGKRISDINHELDEIERQTLARCRILATTVYRTYLKKSVARQFETVVIDEASMLTAPLVYYAAGLATKSVTVAGDFRQLGPIVKSEEPRAKEWLKRDVFEIARIPEGINQPQPLPHLVSLGIQYRMREPICELINDLFYPDRRLRSDPSVNRGDSQFPFSPEPLLYVDTASLGPWAAIPVRSSSRYNLIHALLVRSIILHLAEKGFLPPADQHNDAVGVVTPYAEQARLIQTMLNERLGPRAAGIAATAHRFQGNEKTAMVLDLTASPGASLGKFLEATQLKDEGARLLNVAASRAKHHVVLVANFEYLRKEAHDNAIVLRLLNYFEEHGKALDDPKRLLGLTETSASFELPEGVFGTFTEGDFYSVFRRDLSWANKSIVIFSPFATNPGAERWMKPLGEARARGVRVRILMKPPEEWDKNREIAHTLRARDVVVDLRAGMHEKIAVLDGRILWLGSLNIFSHKNTREIMLRTESQAVCDQISHCVSISASRSDDPPSLDSSEHPGCSKCKGPMVWNKESAGIYFTCEDPKCGGFVDRRRGRRNEKTSPRNAGVVDASDGQPCPNGCGGRLRKIDGKYGPFLGCTNYYRTGCDYTKKLPRTPNKHNAL